MSNLILVIGEDILQDDGELTIVVDSVCVCGIDHERKICCSLAINREIVISHDRMDSSITRASLYQLYKWIQYTLSMDDPVTIGAFDPGTGMIALSDIINALPC